MARIVNRLADHFANESSRRGFLGALGKVALGTVAVVAGVGITSTATAAAPPLCCSGAGGCPTSGFCPPGTTNPYCWLCCYSGTYVQCCDCVNSDGSLNCITTSSTGCPCSGSRIC